jgi:hypothetical protein
MINRGDPLAIGSFRQRQANQNPGDRVNGIKQANPERLCAHLAAEEQAQVGACSAPATPIIKATSINAA